MSNLKIEVFSLLPIDFESAKRQIAALSDFDNGHLRPIRCDASEPIREQFDRANLDEPATWLTRPGGGFFFKRIKLPKVEGYIENRRRPQLWTKGEHGKDVPLNANFPDPLFLTHWTIWIDDKLIVKKGSEYAVQLLLTLCGAARAEYAYAANEEDQKSKNLLVTETEMTITTKFVGTDPECGIPGLYWINVFGRHLTDWLGPGLNAIPATVKTSSDYTIVRFGNSPSESQSEQVRNAQRRSLDMLGPRKFFDMSEPDRLSESAWSEHKGNR